MQNVAANVKPSVQRRPHAVELPRPEVLADDRPDGAGEREDRSDAIGMMRPSTAQPATALSLNCDIATVT